MNNCARYIYCENNSINIRFMELANMQDTRNSSIIEEDVDDISALRDIIIELVDPDKIILFGSYAYGTPHDRSDADFLIIKNGAEYSIKDEADLAVEIYNRRKELGIRTRCDAFLENENQAFMCAEDGGAYADAFQKGKLIYVR